MTVQAIATHYLGPTDKRGSRIVARAAAGRIVVSYDPRHGVERNHAAAARKLAERFGWAGRYEQGGAPDDSGYVFVQPDPASGFTIDRAA
jgi:hypothetical protein